LITLSWAVKEGSQICAPRDGSPYDGGVASKLCTLDSRCHRDADFFSQAVGYVVPKEAVCKVKKTATKDN
jgi:hypothetical protein